MHSYFKINTLHYCFSVLSKQAAVSPKTELQVYADNAFTDTIFWLQRSKSNIFFSLNTHLNAGLFLMNIYRKTHFPVSFYFLPLPDSQLLCFLHSVVLSPWNRWHALCVWLPLQQMLLASCVCMLINWHWGCQYSGTEMDSSWIQKVTRAAVHLFRASYWAQGGKEKNDKEECPTWNLCTLSKYVWKKNAHKYGLKLLTSSCPKPPNVNQKWF